MEFRIADTFTDSLTKLSAQEQKVVKTTAFDLQVDPSHPSHQFHRIDRSRDPNFWSVRAGSDIRLVVHRDGDSLLLCYAGHHDDAYRWAERRRVEVHPRTGAAQVVQVRERIEEIVVPRYVDVPEAEPAPKPLFDRISDDELMAYGVPTDWLEDVRGATEDSLLELAAYLPGEAAEALLVLATGGTPAVAQVPSEGDPYEHPDAQRRFRVVENAADLERAFEAPWEKWLVFLHPAQRGLVERSYSGPARVGGTAGTGKTVVALHRAAYLARTNHDARILLTTFSDPLANALHAKLRLLIGQEPRLLERVDVAAIDAVGLRLYESAHGRARIADREIVDRYLAEAAREVGEARFSAHFLRTEWELVVDAWRLDSWEAYRDVARLGRKTRIPEQRRSILWSVFEIVLRRFAAEGLTTSSQVFTTLAEDYQTGRARPYDHIIIDECQDLSVAQLRFLAAATGGTPDSLFFAGDLGQRIFQQPFSWLSLGVDIRGRSSTLRVNYRTSHQIRQQADRLLAPEMADVDGVVEDRRFATSVFNGPEPTILVLENEEDEMMAVADWISQRRADDLAPHEIGVFVRSEAELDRAKRAVDLSGVTWEILDERLRPSPGRASIGTMHLAKGLEFRAVVVMACDEDVLPLQARIEAVTDDSDLDEVYNTERHLLYVACTRARERLLVTGAAPGSDYLDDVKRSQWVEP